MKYLKCLTFDCRKYIIYTSGRSPGVYFFSEVIYMDKENGNIGFFNFKYNEIPELEKNKKGIEQPIAMSKISNVLNNIGIKISSILKNTGLDVKERNEKIDGEIKNLFKQLHIYLKLANAGKLVNIKHPEEIPLFSKLQNALTVYDNHKGNIKMALQILTEIKEGKNNTCSVLIDDKPKKSKGRWSSILTATLKNLYEDYSNISIKTFSKQLSKSGSDGVNGDGKENHKN